MKNIKKIFSILLASLIIMSVFCGCGKDDDKDKKTKGKNESSDSKYTAEEAEEEIKKVIDGIGKDDSSEVESKPVEDVKVPDGDWTAMNFTLDGKAFKLPVKYEEFKKTGWEINLADAGYANGYVMNPKNKTVTVDTWHSKYRTTADKYSISAGVGFINKDSAAQDITKCDLWCFKMNIDKALRDKKSYPTLVLANGIKWGSTKEQIEKAYGKPKDTYRADDLKYWEYTYKSADISKVMKLMIYDELGLYSVDISDYAY